MKFIDFLEEKKQRVNVAQIHSFGWPIDAAENLLNEVMINAHTRTHAKHNHNS